MFDIVIASKKKKHISNEVLITLIGFAYIQIPTMMQLFGMIITIEAEAIANMSKPYSDNLH